MKMIVEDDFMIEKYTEYTDKDINGMIHEIIRQMIKDNWKPDYIVGITRGGLVPALYISHYLEVNMETLKVSFRDSEDCESNCWMAEDAAEGKNILIIDDIVDKGKTFDWIKQDWQKSVRSQDWSSVWNNNVKFAALIYNEGCDTSVDYYGEAINKTETSQWCVFPWEHWWKDYTVNSGV